MTRKAKVPPSDLSALAAVWPKVVAGDSHQAELRRLLAAPSLPVDRAELMAWVPVVSALVAARADPAVAARPHVARFLTDMLEVVALGLEAGGGDRWVAVVRSATQRARAKQRHAREREQARAEFTRAGLGRSMKMAFAAEFKQRTGVQVAAREIAYRWLSGL